MLGNINIRLMEAVYERLNRGYELFLFPSSSNKTKTGVEVRQSTECLEY